MSEDEELSVLKEIERLTATEPFQPFTIVMGSGTRYDIREGDAIVIERSVITVAVRQSGQHLLRQSQISEITVPEVAT